MPLALRLPGGFPISAFTKPALAKDCFLISFGGRRKVRKDHAPMRNLDLIHSI